MFQPLTVRFGAGLVVVAAVAALLLAVGGGASPSETLLVGLAGATLIAVGLVGRSPARAAMMWLLAVLIAAGLMIGSLRGVTAILNLVSGGGVASWWLLAQGAIVVACGVYIAMMAVANAREGRRAALAAEARRSGSRRSDRARRR